VRGSCKRSLGTPVGGSDELTREHEEEICKVNSMMRVTRLVKKRVIMMIVSIRE